MGDHLNEPKRARAKKRTKPAPATPNQPNPINMKQNAMKYNLWAAEKKCEDTCANCPKCAYGGGCAACEPPIDLSAFPCPSLPCRVGIVGWWCRRGLRRRFTHLPH